MDTNDKETSTNKEAISQKIKQPYHKPQLLIYGDIKTLTQAVGGMSKIDNAMVGNLMSF